MEYGRKFALVLGSNDSIGREQMYLRACLRVYKIMNCITNWFLKLTCAELRFPPDFLQLTANYMAPKNFQNT